MKPDKPKKHDLKFELNLLEHCVTVIERFLRGKLQFNHAKETVASYLRIFDESRGK